MENIVFRSVVRYVKAFVRICNQKDWSHLPEGRLVERQVREGSGGTGGDESQPIVIDKNAKVRINTLERVVKQEGFETDSDEEFSSTEDIVVIGETERKKKKKKRKSKMTKRVDQAIFILEI